MKWIKTILYVFTYFALIYAAKDIISNSYESVRNLFGHVQGTNELNVISSIIVEILTLTLVIIAFFIPIGKKDNGTSINLHYYIDSSYESIMQLITINSTGDKLLKRQTLLSLIYTIFIFFIILLAYIMLIKKLGLIANGLQTLYFLFFTYIIIQLVDFLTDMVIRIDQSKNDMDNTNFIYKKNTITWLIFFVLFFFLYFGIPFVEVIYNSTNDIIGLSLFDNNRIGSTGLQ